MKNSTYLIPPKIDQKICKLNIYYLKECILNFLLGKTFAFEHFFIPFYFETSVYCLVSTYW